MMEKKQERDIISLHSNLKTKSKCIVKFIERFLSTQRPIANNHPTIEIIFRLTLEVM